MFSRLTYDAKQNNFCGKNDTVTQICSNNTNNAHENILVDVKV